MARRSQTASGTNTPVKRSAPTSQTAAVRLSKRLKPDESSGNSLRTTPKRSKYFSRKPPAQEDSENDSQTEDEHSGYEDEDASETSDMSDDGSDFTEKHPISRKRGRPKEGNSSSTSTRPAKGEELWRPGVKTGLGPGKEVRIKLPEARKPGDIPYADGTIHPNTLLFLEDLRNHNDRDWLKLHDADYRTSKKDWDSFVECLSEKVIEKDETIPELPVKDLTFRIYRDIRFTSDPTPYKTHFSAAWSRTGRKGPYAGYYVQIKPNGSFVGGGLWMPEAQPLNLLRRDINRKPHKLKRILTDPMLRKEYFGGISDNEKKAVDAFVAQNSENALKTKPKGYAADHPDISLLRLRSYTIGRKLADSEVLGLGGLGRIADLVGVLTPFITYLNSVVMPDDSPSASEDESDAAE